MTTVRTPEQEAIYQQFLTEATEVIVAMNRRISEQGSKETTFCGPGCTACCHQIFHVHPIEFEVILNRIASDPELRKNFAELSARRQQLTAEHLETITEISKIEDHLEFILQWIKLKIPCALLSPEGRCLAYDVRPLACSTYMTLSPPRVCAIDPKGYMSTPMTKLKDEAWAAIAELHEKYKLPGGLLFDLSWYLDQHLNPPQEEKKKRRKKS
jgi:Fe-S-cluster containining protein